MEETIRMNESGDPGSAPLREHWMKRAIARVIGQWGLMEAGCHTVPELLAFLGWALLVRTGLARKRILTMAYVRDGFFSEFAVLLGLLEHLEKWQGVIAGVRVDFEDQGLYYDPAYGRNSWEYFFQPVRTGSESGASERKVSRRQHDRFGLRGLIMPRARAHGFLARYIHLKPQIRDKIDAFVRAHFEGFHVIGVHYRGTDNWSETARVPFEEVGAAVRTAVGTMGKDDCRLFVASDEQAFVDYMEDAFPGRVLSWETLRSTDGSPTDVRMENNYKKGEDAVMDCLLLSRCNRLMRTTSCLSLFSTYFSPDIPVVLLNPE